MGSVTLERRRGCALAAMSVRKNQLQALERRVHEVFRLRLPNTPKCVTADSITVLWAGVGQWLAMANGEDGTAFERRLRAELGNFASISDQSDGRVIVRVVGARAREALAKGVPIDLHPAAFRPGDVAITTVAYIGVHIWQVDDAPVYELIVPRSYSVSFDEWLTDAAAEFGIQGSLT
jgi:heterotetrameric sarcosine oxidase gamma subunit